MNNPPIKMLLQESTNSEIIEVDVYDFMHDTTETFQSLALCWVEKDKIWTTVPVGFLSPINIKTKTQKLNEEV